MINAKIAVFGVGVHPAEKSRWGDLNPRPADYESAAIPLSHNGAFLILF